MAILGEIQRANSMEGLKEVVFSWLTRNAPEIGVHQEMSFEKAAELANKVGYRNSAALVLQAASDKSKHFSSAAPAQSENATPTD